MTTQTVAFLVGIGLLFVAILGGGITAKEVTIPPLPLMPRLLCGILGAVLFVFGLGLTSVFQQMMPGESGPERNSLTQGEPDRNGASPGGPPRTAARRTSSIPIIRCRDLPQQGAPPAAAVEIGDRLGRGQVYERIEFFVSGQAVGTLCVDRHAPEGTIAIAQTGQQASWTARGSEAKEVSGVTRVRTIVGEGTIDLSGPGHYTVRIAPPPQSNESVQTIWLRPF